MTLPLDSDEQGLYQLHKRLEEVQSGAHTIQILTVDPRVANKLRWLLLSRDRGTYELAVQLFTKYRRGTEHAERTLAFDDNADPKFEYFQWPAQPEDSDQPRLSESNEGELEFFASDFGNVTRPDSQDSLPNTLPKRFAEWRRSLAHFFPTGGSSFWLTVSHRLYGWREKEPPTSAIYLVFDKPVLAGDQDKIKHVARQYLFDQILRFYENQIVSQYEVIEKNIREYLNSEPDRALLSNGTTERIKALRPLLIGRTPLVVEGERGTGKLYVARCLHGMMSESVAEPDDEPRNRPAAHIINCLYLKGSVSEIQRRLVEINLLTTAGDVNNSFDGDVIFDDIQLASAEAQFAIYRLIDSRLAGPGQGERPPWITITVAPSLEKAVGDGQVIREFEMLSPFTITLPTLHDRLGNETSEGRRDLFRNIVQQLGDQARRIVPKAPEFAVDDVVIEHWINQPWKDNYWGLKRAVLEMVINSVNQSSE